MPKIVLILAVDNIAATTAKNKNFILQLSIQEFLDDLYNIMIDDKTSVELSNLT